MRRILIILVFLIPGHLVMAQSPHGEDFVMDCAACHDPSGWSVSLANVTFDHSTTHFDLEGTHALIDCRECHTSFVFDEVENDCISCHQDVHSQSVGNDCVRCHSTDNWLVDEIPELHEENGFPLLGAHTNLSCVECHINETNLRFDRIGNECISCHLDDFQTAENPNHASAGYSTDCITCHSPLAFEWTAEVVVHDFFPLTLGHDINDCAACHDLNNFSNISPECVACHVNDFTATTNPDHQALGFSNDCAACHTLDPDWNPARLDNHNDFYALNGAHADIANDCVACHMGDYNNTPNTCFGCHQSDYNGADDPNHAQLGFSTDCLECHTEDAWEPSTFDHDGQYFPIFSGPHQGEWNSCTDCHTVAGNFAEFSCLGCHREPNTANKHDGVQGYIHESNACLSCHPQGEAD